MLVDAFRKWPEAKVEVTSATTVKRTINLLNFLLLDFQFSTDPIVLDNGLQFTSIEFQNFLGYHHIIHHKSPPYHPATNGRAENMVRSPM